MHHYIQDYLLAERQRERLYAAEQCRLARMMSPLHPLRYVVGRAGVLLITLGSWMKHIEQGKQRHDETPVVAIECLPLPVRVR